MAAHHDRGAPPLGATAHHQATGAAARLEPLRAAAAAAAGPKALQKDETPGGQAEGFKMHTTSTRRIVDSPVTLAPGQQPAVATVPIMTSREIAELLEARHDSVKRTIERLADRGTITSPPLVETTFIGADGKRQAVGEYHVGKRDSYVIVAQLSPEFTARLVDRWQELEASAADPVQAALNDPTLLRRALLTYTEQVVALENRVEELTPKSAALDRIATASKGAVGVRIAAKLMDVPEREFITFLIQYRVLYRDKATGGLAGMANKESVGWVETKRFEVARADGTMRIVARVLITQRGIGKLAELIERKAPHLRKAKAANFSQQAQLTLPMAPAGAQEGMAP